MTFYSIVRILVSVVWTTCPFFFFFFFSLSSSFFFFVSPPAFRPFPFFAPYSVQMHILSAKTHIVTKARSTRINPPSPRLALSSMQTRVSESDAQITRRCNVSVMFVSKILGPVPSYHDNHQPAFGHSLVRLTGAESHTNHPPPQNHPPSCQTTGFACHAISDKERFVPSSSAYEHRAFRTANPRVSSRPSPRCGIPNMRIMTTILSVWWLRTKYQKDASYDGPRALDGSTHGQRR